MAISRIARVCAKGKNSDPGVTNVRNVTSPHWRRWLGIESRCVVPWTSFSENEVLPDGSRPPVWFAFDKTRPLAFFAGIWTRWTSARKVKEGETTNDIFAFLTTEPNKGVGAIHPLNKALHPIPPQIAQESYRENHIAPRVFTQPGSCPDARKPTCRGAFPAVWIVPECFETCARGVIVLGEDELGR